MKRFLIILLGLLGIGLVITIATPGSNEFEEYTILERLFSPDNLQNHELPGRKVVELAIRGYNKLIHTDSVHHPEIFTIIDYSLPSDKERMWIFNMASGKLLYHCLVAHGRNSGERFASRFSNKPGSHASSLGFYLTGDSYDGKNGLSLHLDGLEKGINDKARQRAIVIHGASYVTPKYVSRYGTLGRSYGCPALPPQLTKEIIDTIRGGSFLFIYAPDNQYLANSKILN